ncbi:MAG TPA: hydroxymethylglutaryl-CoA lyase [Cytophagales bacterium]|nr:hydroxymethylglutaryl-CoA lyase [Cytophagales bacterium]HAA19488.1 hydroxymethylglutaryl-CoA lyase [Cytophagales bacterium]HAP59637.1 hydroxymethylglutaryl-CoA lyase [Cytophagales bacterium]
MLKLIECPRDAMQGIHDFIPTEEKVKYLNTLLKVGFDTLDFGSFVSPKAIPQLRDTAEVLAQLELDTTATKLLAIVANVRGAQDACQFEAIRYLGFPLSVSETFQQRNTNKSIGQALEVVKEIQELCKKHDKEQVVYLSMGFGNPYGDPYSPSVLVEFVEKLDKLGIRIVSLADTIGVSTPELIRNSFGELIPAYPGIEFGAHLHSHPTTIHEKVEAVVEANVNRIDTAMKGFGGCPMAEDDLVGNLATEAVIETLRKKEVEISLDNSQIITALAEAGNLFGTYA